MIRSIDDSNKYKQPELVSPTSNEITKRTGTSTAAWFGADDY